MEKTWRDRLREAVEADPRSPRQISLAAKLGPNYLQQLFKDEKEPGIEKVLRVLAELGTGKTLYVISGVELSADEERMLAFLLSADEQRRGKLLGFVEGLEAQQQKPGLQLVPPPEAVASDQKGRKRRS